MTQLRRMAIVTVAAGLPALGGCGGGYYGGYYGGYGYSRAPTTSCSSGYYGSRAASGGEEALIVLAVYGAVYAIAGVVSAVEWCIDACD